MNRRKKAIFWKIDLRVKPGDVVIYENSYYLNKNGVNSNPANESNWLYLGDFSKKVLDFTFSNDETLENGFNKPLENVKNLSFSSADFEYELDENEGVLLIKQVRNINGESEIIYGDLKPVNSQAVEKYAVKKINTIADLRNTVGDYEGQVVELLGYYDPAENKQLKYTWTFELITDDGGYTISDNINGTWLHEVKDIVKLEDYGIKEGEYIDAAFNSALKYTDSNLEIEFPRTVTTTGFKVANTKFVKGKIKGNSTKLTFDSKQAAYFQVTGDFDISGFICECIHTTTPTFDNVPYFIYKNVSTIKGRIANNNIKNLRITLNADSSNITSKNVIIEDNYITCDFTGFPIYNIQNDIITVYNGENIFIRRNVIKAIHTNRCFKISSISTDGMEVLSSNIHINDNEITLNGSIEVNNNSKQLLDLYQNSFNIYIYNNKIKSRGYTHLFENKSSSSFNENRYMHIYKNIIDTDLCSIYREVGNYGNITQTESTGIVRTVLEQNDIIIHGEKESEIVFVNQTIGVDYIDYINNYIESKDAIVILVHSNCRRGSYKDNILKNVIVRNTFSSINGMGDNYESKYQNYNIKGNFFYFDKAPIDSGTYGAVEIRANNPKVNSLNVIDNIFDNTLTNTNFRPINMSNSEVLNSVILNNNSNMGSPIIGPTNITSIEVVDYGNSWVSLNDRKLFFRVPISTASVSLNPKRACLMYDLTGSTNSSVTINASTYPNNGGFYIFKNSTTSNTLTLIQGSGVILPNIVLNAGESVLLMTYENNQYRVIMQSSKPATTTVKGLVNQSSQVNNVSTTPPSPLSAQTVTTIEEVQTAINNIVTMVNAMQVNEVEFKAKLNAKLTADRNSGQQVT